MLRALGIAFIVCSVLFVGSFMLAVGWWAIASGTVRIAGINDEPAADQPAQPAASHAVAAGPVSSSGQPPAIPVAQTPPAVGGSPEIPVRTATRTSEAAAVPSAASVAFEPFSDRADEIVRELRTGRAVTLLHVSGGNAADSLRWAPSRSAVLRFLPSTDALVFTYRSTDQELTNDLQMLIDNCNGDQGATEEAEEALGILFASDPPLNTVSFASGANADEFRIVTQVGTRFAPGRVFEAGLNGVSSGPQRIEILPDDSVRPAPRVLRVFNGRFQPNSAAFQADDTIPVYDILRLNLAASVTNRPRFFLQNPAGQSAVLEELTPRFLARTPAGDDLPDGEVSLELGAFGSFNAGDTATLYVLAGESDALQFADPLRLEFQQDTSGDVDGAELTLTASGATDSSGISYISDPRVPVELAITNLSGVNHLDAVIRSDASPSRRPLLIHRLTGTSGKMTLGTITLPSVGPQTLRVELYQGARQLQLTAERSVTVLSDGPTVQTIDTSGFQFTAAGENSVVLRFGESHPLKTGSTNGGAENKAHYELRKAGTTDELLAENSGNVHVTYEPTRGTVTLQFDFDLENGGYVLLVKPSLEDIVGNPLQKSRAVPRGRIYEVPISKDRGNTLSIGEQTATFPSQQRGLTATSGPYVPFPEYTEPRSYPPGFNPSDKVVTRVARLYYFRDAHRVTQIINRKATSYNRASVDMKQQFADAKRRETDLVTAKRRELENVAVRAAQQARAAENALDEHQRALSQLRDTLAEREASLRSLNDQIRPLEQRVAASPDDSAGRQTLERLQATRDQLEQNITNTEADIRDAEARVRALMARVQVDRDVEIRATAEWEKADQEEARRLRELFQREVAAKTEDPDTYAPGVPDSNDPVEQVSVSVVGEGLIQLRGPRKGVNEVHKMINELDAPVGQVKVAIHTVQVNGEGGERMEEVVYRIQRYIDHSRFLTLQSAQMLRNAVVSVASRRASQVLDLCPPGMPQELRDYKYQEAFFGAEFIQELRSLDSEFLMTGNKVLSLHSMDTTSLSNALFLLALAKNDVREEILAEFMTTVQCRLPQYELEYYQGSAPKPDYHDRPLKERLFNREAQRNKFVHQPPFRMMAQNAQFASLRGMFDVQIAGPDTLSPMQREFIRLAQIFKARLVTEVELRQRVMERALIEERIGAAGEYLDRLKTARDMESRARAQVVEFEHVLNDKTTQLLITVNTVRQTVENTASVVDSAAKAARDAFSAFDTAKANTLAALQGRSVQVKADTVNDQLDRLSTRILVTPLQSASSSDNMKELASDPTALEAALNAVMSPLRSMAGMEGNLEYQIRQELTSQLKKQDAFSEQALVCELAKLSEALGLITSNYELSPPYRRLADRAASLMDMEDAPDDSNWLIRVQRLNAAREIVRCIATHVLRETRHALDALDSLSDRLKRAAEHRANLADLPGVIADWRSALSRFAKYLTDETELKAAVTQAEGGFQELETAYLQFVNSRQLAENARRPLDHKKFLDMLIDDVEEKYIELVEGTRAQIANIDNYLQRLSTALEDDFNTQFYHPAFRYVRESSYFYDVSVGQVETTSVVANNRAFAKVSPQATMEFDLPKRDILINEAMNSALAAYNDYGALLSDPNFLALTRLYGGQPAAATYGNAGASPYIQEVLPGLPSGTDAQFLTSPDNNTPRIGANLEALIPDPAIYKFETGTGYEVRPVIQPDGQAVVFHFNYMYTTNIREPVRADEKHLGRVKRHFIDTDVVSGNYELREVSTYRVGLKAARSSRGVPFLEDVPGVGVLFRPQVNAESSLQQNIVLSQTVIYPTLFDLMGLRWAPAVADLDSLSLREREFVTRNREKVLRNEVFDYSSIQVDDFLRIPEAERRGDLYRTQETIPQEHPNQYRGPGLNLQDGILQEGYDPEAMRPPSQAIPGDSQDAPFPLESPPRQPVLGLPPGVPRSTPLTAPLPIFPDALEGSQSRRQPDVDLQHEDGDAAGRVRLSTGGNRVPANVVRVRSPRHSRTHVRPDSGVVRIGELHGRGTSNHGSDATEFKADDRRSSSRRLFRWLPGR